MDQVDPNAFKMFDDQGSDSDDIVEKKGGAQVARPTTKPTDKTRMKAKESYTYWTEKDKDKLATYP